MSSIYKDSNLLQVKFEAAALSDPGKLRAKNEDRVLVMEKYGCFAVSDGMGGGEAGEIASKMIVERLADEMRASGTSPAARERAVIRSAYACNDDIGKYCADHNFDAMGATLVCLLLDSWNPNFCSVFHSGDSRLYRYREGQLQLLTNDHTFANLHGTDERELPKSQQGVLTNILGISSDFFLERDCFDIKRKDILILCSDGLNRMVDDDSIACLLRRSTDVSASILAQLLVAEALGKGGHDNVSVVVIKIHKCGFSHEPMEWELQEEALIQEQNVFELSDTLPTEGNQ